MNSRTNNSRRNTKSYNANRACESLEARRLFTAELVPPPEPPQQVNDVEFNFEHAPHQLRFTFNEDVSGLLDPSDLTLINSLSRQVYTGDAFEMQYDKATNSAIFKFAGSTDGVLPDGNWNAALSLNDATPPSPAPSPIAGSKASDQPTTEGNGSGNANGIFNFNFQFLRGDATHDGAVDAHDFLIMAANFGQSNRTFSHGDFDYSGKVDAADFAILNERFGMSLPPPMISEIGAGPSCGEPLGRGESPFAILPTE